MATVAPEPAAAPTGVDFVVGYAKSGRSRCRATRALIAAGALRIGRMVADGWAPGERRVHWHTVDGFFGHPAAHDGLHSTHQLHKFGRLKIADQRHL
jgi:hypothetical protein